MYRQPYQRFNRYQKDEQETASNIVKSINCDAALMTIGFTFKRLVPSDNGLFQFEFVDDNGLQEAQTDFFKKQLQVEPGALLFNFKKLRDQLKYTRQ